MFDILEQWQRSRCPVCGMPDGDLTPVINAARVVLDRTGFGPSATMRVTSPDLDELAQMTKAELADRAEALARRARADADEEADARRALAAPTEAASTENGDAAAGPEA